MYSFRRLLLFFLSTLLILPQKGEAIEARQRDEVKRYKNQKALKSSGESLVISPSVFNSEELSEESKNEILILIKDRFNDGKIESKISQNFKMPDQAWTFSVELQNMLEHAKDGNMTLSYIARDRAIVRFIESYQYISKYTDNHEFTRIVFAAIFSWALTQTKITNTGGLRRVEYILKDFNAVLFDESKLKEFKSIYSAEYGLQPLLFWVIEPIVYASQKIALNLKNSLVEAKYEEMISKYIKQLRVIRQNKTEIDESELDLFEAKENILSKQDYDRLITPEMLKTYISQKSYLASEMHTLVDQAYVDPILAQRLNDVIKQDNDLLDKAILGRNFRLAYIEKLTHAFGQDYNFVLDPERAIQNALLFEKTENEKITLTELALHQAEKLALVEARNQYGLPEHIDSSQLEQLKYNSDEWMNIYDFYRKRFYINQNKDTYRYAEQEPDIEDFKIKMSQKINNLRIKNLKSALSIYKDENPKNSLVALRTINGIERVTISDLLTAKVQIVGTGEYFASIPQASPRLNDGLMKRATSRLITFGSTDHLNTHDFYEVSAVSPFVMRNKIIFKTKTQNITLDEASFSRLLYELGPLRYSMKKDDNLNERLLIEASRRDAMLANALNELLNDHDQTTESVIERFNQVISSRLKNSWYSKTFSEEIRDHYVDGLDKNEIVDLRWYGYKLHPDFWRAQESDAEMYNSLSKIEKNKAEQNSVDNNKTSKVESDKTRNNEVQVNNNEEIVGVDKSAASKVDLKSFWRYKSMTQRVKSFLIQLTTVAAIITGLVWGTIEGIEAAHSYINKKDSNNGAMVFDIQDPKNISLREANLGGPAPIIVIKANEDSRPEYLNFSTLKNLPDNLIDHELQAYKDQNDAWLEEIRSLREDKKIRKKFKPNSRIELDGSIVEVDAKVLKDYPLRYDTKRSDIVLQSIRPIAPTENQFMSLPTPNGYRISSIEIRQHKYEYPISGKDYEVYYDNRTGLSYLKFSYGNWSEYEKATFDYVIAYTKIGSLDQSLSDEPLNKNELYKLNKELSNLGAKELANNLNDLLKTNETVTVQDITSVFKSSGLYTFSPTSPTFKWWPLNNDFREYKKFLKDGILYYQCSGSNSLLKEYLLKYFATQKSKFTTQNLVGLTFEMKDGKLDINPVGHMHTLISDFKSSYRFQELDATPVNMDPENENLKDKVPRGVDKKKDEEKKIKKLKNPIPKPLPLQDPKTMLMVSSSRPQLYTQKETRTREQLKNEANEEFIEAVEKLRTHIKDLRLAESSQASTIASTGLRALSLISLIEAYYKSENIDFLLEELIKIKYGISATMKDNHAISKFVLKKKSELKTQFNLSDEELGLRLIKDAKDTFNSFVSNIESSNGKESLEYLKDGTLVILMNNFLNRAEESIQLIVDLRSEDSENHKTSLSKPEEMFIPNLKSKKLGCSKVFSR